MILEGTETVKRYGKDRATTVYYVVVRCDFCGSEKPRVRLHVKDKKEHACIKCSSGRPALREAKRGKTPSNFQIKCLVPCEWCGKDLPRTKKRLSKHSHSWCGTSCQVKWQHVNTDFNRGKNNNSPDNLKTLCKSCHLKTHWEESR